MPFYEQNIRLKSTKREQQFVLFL